MDRFYRFTEGDQNLKTLCPGNPATQSVQIRVPRGTIIHEGTVAPQPQWTRPGGGHQVYIERVDPRWIIGAG